MEGSFGSYTESYEDYDGVGTSSVYEDRSDRQPYFEDDDIEHDTASTHGHSHIPHFAYNNMRPPPHRSSDPCSVQGTDSGYQTSYYASSEPSPELYGSRRRHSSRERGYHDDRKNRELEDCQKRLERCRRRCKAAEEVAEGKIESLRIRLFHSLKEAKKYDDAEEMYHETAKKYDDAEKLSPVTVTGKEPTKSEHTVILDLKYSFAAMLIEQKKFQEAEPISRAVWEKRKQCPGLPSELFKESHRQLCSILCAVGRHKEAENMHRSMYQRETMDAWALENGDEVCQRQKEQGEIKKAKEMQDEVWKERLKQHGPRDGLTIRSALRLIGFLEQLVATIDYQGFTDAERRLNISHKRTSECEIEVILRKIWDTRLHPEPSADVLDAGHKLGSVLFLQNKFPEAEAIFMPVWEGKKQQLGDRHVSTMSTGNLLGKTLQRQGKRETSIKAVHIFQGIWLVRRNMMKNGDAETISIGEDLAQAYFSLEDWAKAEHAYTWIINQKVQRGCSAQETDNARWSLGQTFYRQGSAKDREAEIVLGELYKRWIPSSPNSNLTLQCGQMLAQSLSTQNGKTNEALKVALDVFNGCASVQRDVAYLDSGRLYGSLLLEVDNFAEAERILESVWEHQAEGAEEQKMRLKCGNLYGQALAKRHKYPDAKRILETVAEAQGTVSAGVDEIAETRRLLEEVSRLKKEREKEKRNSFRSRKKGLFF